MKQKPSVFVCVGHIFVMGKDVPLKCRLNFQYWLFVTTSDLHVGVSDPLLC